MRTATIYHAGGWNVNWGDRVIQWSMREHLKWMAQPHNLKFRYIDYQNEVFTDELIHEINEQADLLLIGPGGAVMNREHGCFQVQIDPAMWQALLVPVVVHSVGWNEFPYNDEIIPDDNLYAAHERADIWTWRNNGSRLRGEEYGLGGEVIADAALFAGDRVDGKYDTTSKVMGLCTAGDRPEQRWRFATESDVVWPVITLPSMVLSQYNLLCLRHHPTDLGKHYEEPALERVPSFIRKYNALSVVVGMRKHSLIIPYGLYTKAIGLGDQDEVRWFLEDMGEEQYLVTSENLDELPDKVDQILADDEWEGRVRGKKKVMKEAFYGSLWKILNLAGIHEVATA